MQVVCPNCQASYEFDPASIPAQGYDAQCTQCAGVFFVKPEEPAPAQVPMPVQSVAPPVEPAQTANPDSNQPIEIPAVAPGPAATHDAVEPALPIEPAVASTITVACGTCGATYSFAPTDIPAEGYDAQCTSCASVFFVSREPIASAPIADPPLTQDVQDQGEAPVSAAESGPDAVEFGQEAAAPTSAPTATDLGPVDLTAESGLEFADPVEGIAATPGPESEAAPTPAAEPSEPVAEAPAPLPAIVESPSDGDDVRRSTMLELSSSLGDPEDAPHGASMEDDFEALQAAKKRRTFIAIGVLAAVPVLIFLLYVLVPGAFDATVGPLIGVKARIAPEAIPHKDAAVTLLLQDTIEGYEAATKKVSEALAIDSQYPEAIAVSALSDYFLGQIYREKGLLAQTKAQKLLAELKSLGAVKKKTPAVEAKLSQIQGTLQTVKTESEKWRTLSDDTFSRAEATLAAALQENQEWGDVIIASGIVMVGRDPGRTAEAAKRMRVGARLLGIDDPATQQNNLWVMYLNALVDGGAAGDLGKVETHYQAILAKEPNFQRVRFELATLAKSAGRNDQARKIAKEITAAVPTHRATEFLKVAPKPPPPAAKPTGRSSKRKKRRR